MKNKILILLFALSFVSGYGQNTKNNDLIEVCLNYKMTFLNGISMQLMGLKNPFINQVLLET